MKITHSISLDFRRYTTPSQIDVVQDDTYSRYVAVSLYDNAAEWPVPDGATIAVRFKKPDKTQGVYDTLPNGEVAYSIDGNVVTVGIAPQMLVAKGKVTASAVIYLSSVQLATFPFVLNVVENPAAGQSISNDYYYLQTWDDVNAAIGSLADLETALAEDVNQLKGDLNELQNGGYVADQQQIGQKVNAWLDEHPEATTTVQDNSLTINKMVVGTLGYVTPEMFGAVGDGVTDDTQAVQSAIDNNENLQIVLSKVYKVSTVSVTKPILISGGTLVSDTIPMIVETHSPDCKIRSVTFEGNEISLHIKDCNHLTIEGCTFKNGEYGVKVEEPTVEVIMRGCYIKSKNGNNGIGLYVYAGDGEYSNITIVNYKTAIKSTGYNVFDKVHAWIWDNTICKGSIFFHALWKASSSIVNSYADSYDIGFRLNDIDNFVIDNPNFFWNNIIFPENIVPTLFSFYSIADAKKVWIKNIKANYGDKKVYFSSLGTTLDNLTYDSLRMSDSFSLLNNISTSWLNSPIIENKITPIKDVYNRSTSVIGNLVFINFGYYSKDEELNNETVIATVSIPPKENYYTCLIGTNETLAVKITTDGSIKTTPMKVGEYRLSAFYIF